MEQGTTNSTTFIAEDHLDFLKGLAHDESLRAALQANPAETLAKYGIEIGPGSLPSEIKLPDASAIEDSLSAGAFAELIRTLVWLPFLEDDVN